MAKLRLIAVCVLQALPKWSPASKPGLLEMFSLRVPACLPDVRVVTLKANCNEISLWLNLL